MFQPQKSSAPRGIRHKAGYLHVAARPPGDLRARIRQLQDSFRELHDRGSFSAPDVNRTRNMLTARRLHERVHDVTDVDESEVLIPAVNGQGQAVQSTLDRKSTRLNSSN